MTGQKLRLFREFRNYSQEYIAEKLGITQNAYSRIENNQTRMTTERLHMLSAILKISTQDLLSDKEPVIHCGDVEPDGHSGSREEHWREWMEDTRQLYGQVICSKDEKIAFLEKEIHSLRLERDRIIHLVEKLTTGDLAS